MWLANVKFKDDFPFVAPMKLVLAVHLIPQPKHQVHASGTSISYASDNGTDVVSGTNIEAVHIGSSIISGFSAKWRRWLCKHDRFHLH